MKRKETIKDKKEFNDIIKNSSFHRNKNLVLYYKERTDNEKMYAVAISRQVGKAHLRNYLKRITRVSIDQNRKLFKNGFNYIIMIRKNCADISFQELNDSLIDLLKQ